MDINIAKIFNQINENTEGYSKIIGDSLEKYLKGFKDATKDISKQFADATLALSEEVRRLNGASDSTKAQHMRTKRFRYFEGDGGYDLSISDLMSALCCIFILVTISIVVF